MKTIMMGKMEMELPDMYMMNRFIGTCLKGPRARSQLRLIFKAGSASLRTSAQHKPSKPEGNEKRPSAPAGVCVDEGRVVAGEAGGGGQVGVAARPAAEVELPPRPGSASLPPLCCHPVL